MVIHKGKILIGGDGMEQLALPFKRVFTFDETIEKWKAELESRFGDEEMFWFINYYNCPICGCEWGDEWSAMCDDECPNCYACVSPYHSEVI